MPRRCAVYGCCGNYRGEPYTKTVSFPTDEETRSKWITAPPNDSRTFVGRKEIWICHACRRRMGNNEEENDH